MLVFSDYEGSEVRLTDERLYGHIALVHPRVLRIENAIEQTLSAPDATRIDFDDDDVRLYYRRLERVWIIVAVAFKSDDAFVLTAYTANRGPIG